MNSTLYPPCAASTDFEWNDTEQRENCVSAMFLDSKESPQETALFVYFYKDDTEALRKIITMLDTITKEK